MKLKYNVSRDNYIEMLEMQLKRRGKRPLSILITLLCTVGQMGLLVYMIATGQITGKNVYILAAMSVVITILNIIYRLTTHRRAVVTLQRFELQNKLSPDFWKEHDFRLDSDSLTIRFGSLRSVYDLSEINGYEELPSSFLLYCRGTVADIIPYSALPGGKEEFLEALRVAQHEKVVDDAQQLRDDVPEVYKYHFHYAYTLESYVSQQQEAYRRLYTTKLILKVSNFIRLGITLYALGFAYMQPTPLVIAVCAAAVLVCNLQHIITFTPLSKITIKNGISDALAHNPDPQTDTYITPDNIIIRGSIHSLDIPICDVKAMRRIKGGVALYLPNNVILTIPNTDTVDDGEFEKFIKFMDYKAN